MIDYTLDSDGVAHIVWNNPNGTVNIKNAESMAAFVAAADRAIADMNVKGVIVTSAKRDFLAGGDIDSVYAAATPEQAIANVCGVAACLRRLERSGKPFVAALNGSAIGGGLEVALACHRRIASDAPGLRVGMPETSLGLIPGSGGTQRLPRLIGVGPATRLMMEAKTVDAAEGLKLGILDQIVPADMLVATARDWVLKNPAPQQPWDKKNFTYRDFDPQSREGRWFFFFAWPQLRRKSPAEDLAQGALLHVLAQGLERGIDAGLAIESRYFGMVASSPSAKNRIRTEFYAKQAARKFKRRPQNESAFEPTKVGVIGAGLMGGGIALVCAKAGLETVLLDTSVDAAEKGKTRIAKSLENAITRGTMKPARRDEILGRITTGTDYALLAGAQLVAEAVVEVPAVKKAVFGQIVAAAGEDVIIASNTSTLSISSLAAELPKPDRLIGLHFFAPVDRMALVEVILGEQTSARTHAHSLDFLKRIAKTAVVAHDGPGFFTSRVVAAYTREALSLLAEGVSPALIDNAALTAGMPIGPLAMGDLTSYDLLVDILGSLKREGRGTAVESDRALDAARRLVEAGRVGRKGAGGVYDYDERGKVVWSGIKDLFPALPQQPDVTDVTHRLLHIQSLETVHAIDEGVVEDALEIDLASVLGWSYPAWRGGVLAHIDDVGAATFVAQCEALAERHGSRFRAPSSLKERAKTNRRFHDAVGATT